MKLNLWLAAIAALLVLSACSSDSNLKYLETRGLPNLEVPPDLTRITLNEKFKIPPGFSGATGETVNRIPVLAQVESFKVEGSSDFYWLSIEGEGDGLYQAIKNFWASEGYSLVIDEPIIGIMQTQWVLIEEGDPKEDAGFFASLFSGDDLSASQDQFRTRIEKHQPSGATRVYIAHRGTQYQHTTSTARADLDEPDKWAFRPPEPELEVEMLSRLMIYLGLQKAEVEQQFEKVKLFAPLASIHTNNAKNEVYLLVRDVQQKTWNRLLHVLNRLDFEILAADPSSGLSGDGVVLVETAIQTEEKEGGFFSIFSSDTRLVNKQIALIVSDETHQISRISIETPDGKIEETPEAADFLTMIYEHIK